MTNPTPRTRKQLRDALRKARNEATALHNAIQGAGLRLEDHYRGDYYIADAISMKEYHRRAEQAALEAKAETRRETLEKVIEALKLTEYGYREPDTYAFFIPGTSDKRPGHERLWEDLNTALEERDAAKRAADRKKTAEKVAGLTKSRVEISVSGLKSVIDTIDDNLKKTHDAGKKLPKPKKKAKPDDDARPDKDPKGGTQPVIKPKKESKK